MCVSVAAFRRPKWTMAVGRKHHPPSRVKCFGTVYPYFVKTGMILSYMKMKGITLQGCHRTATRWGYIMTIGLDDEDERIKAGKILSNTEHK